ncbi:hypothetical protein J116_000215 [Streptomyces thermolilacinus SPC6]|uniref:Uncharacterized protein n=2 Tax=Streptomyces thermolilacinus TaxID=285540 RepID=A0A1D3DZG5_9ACTN|nr:hypothetical protein J116_000215 [Streptomyces thermolilacinus SPC6]
MERGVARWSIETGCEDCPHGGCEQGCGRVPEYVRQALLRSHGPVRLRPQGEPPRTAVVMRALREAFPALPPETARALADELAGPGLTGTLVEMEHLAGRLRARSVTVVVEPLGARGMRRRVG